ncbi:MAG: NmrA/HSCARG family protein [Hyphomicrobiaceae bacterium]|nr:MAG: NmrA/HSCARG family protein [Hyphomicrobiaceae bacterium]
MADIKPPRTIVVLGATGQQGGAVTRALAADSQWRIRTVSRDLHSEAARGLAGRGFEVVAANMDDPKSLLTAFKGAHGVFSVQGSDQGGEVETKRGIAVADAALAAGIAHFIYASVGGADRQSAVPHFDSKWRIEEHIRRIGLPATVVRPVFFMDNFIMPSLRTVLMALMRSYVPKDKKLQMIAVDDIGKWVARAFADPQVFIGTAEEIAGDELTRSEFVAAFKARGWYAGLPVPVPRLLLRALPGDILKMFAWFGSEGYRADIAALRTRQPELLRFSDWLSANKGSSSIAGNMTAIPRENAR